MGITKVAPHAGAWIEISNNPSNILFSVSLPTRERGLKSFGQAQYLCRG